MNNTHKTYLSGVIHRVLVMIPFLLSLAGIVVLPLAGLMTLAMGDDAQKTQDYLLVIGVYGGLWILSVLVAYKCFKWLRKN